MDLEIKGWIERYPAKVITTFSRLYCSIISRGDFSSKIESLHQNVSQKGIIWPSKIQLETSKSEKKWLEDGLQDSPISASQKKNTWILSRRGKSLRNNLWSCERIHLTPTLHHNGTVVSGTTSNSLVPEGIPSKQKGGSVSGLWVDIYQKSCKGYHPKKSCQGYNSPLIIHYNRWILVRNNILLMPTAQNQPVHSDLRCWPLWFAQDRI